MMQADGKPVALLGATLPSLVSVDKAWAHALEDVHEWLGNAMIGLDRAARRRDAVPLEGAARQHAGAHDRRPHRTPAGSPSVAITQYDFGSSGGL